MKELITSQTTDFTIIGTGEAFISQTKVAELCGVHQSSISKFIKGNAHRLKLNEINQLSDESANLCIGYYAEKGNAIAVQTLIKLSNAGMQAYIYNQMGFNIVVTQIETKPKELSATTLKLIEIQDQIEKGYLERQQLKAERAKWLDSINAHFTVKLNYNGADIRKVEQERDDLLKKQPQGLEYLRPDFMLPSDKEHQEALKLLDSNPIVQMIQFLK